MDTDAERVTVIVFSVFIVVMVLSIILILYFDVHPMRKRVETNQHLVFVVFLTSFNEDFVKLQVEQFKKFMLGDNNVVRVYHNEKQTSPSRELLELCGDNIKTTTTATTHRELFAELIITDNDNEEEDDDEDVYYCFTNSMLPQRAFEPRKVMFSDSGMRRFFGFVNVDEKLLGIEDQGDEEIPYIFFKRGEVHGSGTRRDIGRFLIGSSVVYCQFLFSKYENTTNWKKQRERENSIFGVFPRHNADDVQQIREFLSEKQ